MIFLAGFWSSFISCQSLIQSANLSCNCLEPFLSPERSLKSVIYHFPIVTARTALSRTSLISLIATLSPCGCKAFRNGIWNICCRWQQGDSEETHFLVFLPLFLDTKMPKQLCNDFTTFF